MKIYTKTGDSGTTSLVDNSRVHKSDDVIEAVGDIDEANARVGFLAECVREKHILTMLRFIQSRLFDCGAIVAGVDSNRVNNIGIESKDVARLESSIDRMSRQLPPLETFILPGGGEASARAHLARSAVRSAERRVVAVSQKRPVTPVVLQYLNRLSDWLFIVARWLAKRDGQIEIAWQKRDGRDTT